MQALKLKAIIGPDHRLELTVPDDLPQGEVEVILLAPNSAPTGEHAAGESLRAFFQELDRSPRQRLSKEEIDRYLEEERANWD